ncbi:MAG TPA: VOC family protein [Nocardioides sp.]|nr:VOC family protein [Nocardioides sp.]
MPRIASVVIHCSEPAVLAPFWSLVTGIPVVDADLRAIADGTLGADEAVLLRSDDDRPDVWLAPAEELRAPGRVHLDVVATEEEKTSFLEAGATVVAERPKWTVLADPEGNEFCVFPERH